MRIFQTRPALSCGILLAERPNGGPYRRPRPIVEGPRSDALARAVLRHMFEEVEPPPAQVVLLRDATVRGPGIITLPGDIVVAESLINAQDQDAIGDLRRAGPGSFAAEPSFPAGQPAPPGRHVLLKQLWDMNYGHWLIEGLPRMGLLEGLPGIADCRFVISTPEGMPPLVLPMRNVMAESLACFGVERDRIVLSGWSPQFFPELIYPLPLTCHPWVKAPLVVQILEDLGRRVGAPPDSPARIFVRRPATSRRRLLNEDAVAALLATHGFTPITPAALAFADQARIFANASHVVGTLGAECSNLVFSPRGLRFLGLAPEHMQDDFFYDLVGLKAGAYVSLHGAAAGQDHGMNADFTIDPIMLEAVLSRFEGPDPINAPA